MITLLLIIDEHVNEYPMNRINLNIEDISDKAVYTTFFRFLSIKKIV